MEPNIIIDNTTIPQTLGIYNGLKCISGMKTRKMQIYPSIGGFDVDVCK